jgi:hypothetical protein
MEWLGSTQRTVLRRLLCKTVAKFCQEVMQSVNLFVISAKEVRKMKTCLTRVVVSVFH